MGQIYLKKLRFVDKSNHSYLSLLQYDPRFFINFYPINDNLLKNMATFG